MQAVPAGTGVAGGTLGAVGRHLRVHGLPQGAAAVAGVAGGTLGAGGRHLWDCGLLREAAAGTEVVGGSPREVGRHLRVPLQWEKVPEWPRDAREASGCRERTSV